MTAATAGGKVGTGSILYKDARNLKVTEPGSADEVSLTFSLGTKAGSVYLHRKPYGKKMEKRLHFVMMPEALLALKNLLNSIEFEIEEAPS